MKMRYLAAVAVLAALTLTGCSDVVDGTGSEATGSNQSTGPTDTTTDGPTDTTTDGPTDTTTDGPTTAPPSTGGTDPSPDFSCPDITYSSARMTFNCISNNMRVATSGKVFSITMTETVETASGWQMEMGAKLYTGTATSFPAISADVRRDLLDAGGYGPNPAYDLDSVDYSTISGLRAYTTIDTVTINSTYAASKKSAVKVEKRWLVIIELGSGRYTTWFASIPDLAQQYWAQVPTAIASIKINQ